MLDKLPESFWNIFADELAKIFKIDIFEKDKDYCRALDFLSGTCGWHDAVEAACRKAGVKEFFNWYDMLDWIESDKFDSDLVAELIKRFT